MSALTDYAEQKILELLLNGVAITPFTAYVGLANGAGFTDSSAANEVSAGGYARQAAGTFTVEDKGGGLWRGDNDATITFGPATASWGTVVDWGIFDAASGGNMWVHGSILTGSQSVESGNVLQFPIGGLRNEAQ